MRVVTIKVVVSTPEGGANALSTPLGVVTRGGANGFRGESGVFGMGGFRLKLYLPWPLPWWASLQADPGRFGGERRARARRRTRPRPKPHALHAHPVRGCPALAPNLPTAARACSLTYALLHAVLAGHNRSRRRLGAEVFGPHPLLLHRSEVRCPRQHTSTRLYPHMRDACAQTPL